MDTKLKNLKRNTPAKKKAMLTLLIFIVFSFVFSQPALAQQAFPNKMVRIIVPYPPGAGTDIIGRVLGQKLGELWGQPVVIDNRPGAAGTVGVNVVANSSPDGYNIVLAVTGALTIAPSLNPKLPYDPVRDLSPVTLVAAVPGMLAIHPSTPANNVSELITLVKARPGHFTFGSAGNGTSTHLSGELFKAMAGINILHVPYKGGMPALSGLLGEEVSMTFETVPGSLPFARSGKIKALAVTSRVRFAELPDLPTIAETLPGYESTTWYGLLVRAGTPKDIIAKIHEDVMRTLAMSDVRDKLAGMGAVIIGSTPDAFAEYMRNELQRFAKIIKEAKIRSN